MLTCKHGIKPLKNCSECLLENTQNSKRNYSKSKKGRENYKRYYNKNIKNTNFAHERRKKNREKLLKLIGDKCLICNSNKRLCFHEVNGKSHNSDNIKYYIENYKDFIPLCYHHHKLIHSLGELNLNKLNEVLKFSEILRNP